MRWPRWEAPARQEAPAPRRMAVAAEVAEVAPGGAVREAGLAVAKAVAVTAEAKAAEATEAVTGAAVAVAMVAVVKAVAPAVVPGAERAVPRRRSPVHGP